MKRKDKNGRVLYTGESQLSNGTYEYRWSDYYGNRKKIRATTLNGLREKQKDIQLFTLEKKNFESMNLNTLIEKWLYLKQNVKESTLNAYRTKYETSIKPTKLGRTKINNIKQGDIILFIREAQNKGLKSSTINISYTIIKQSLQFAYNDGILSKNPIANMKKLKTDAPLKFALNDIEAQELLDRIQCSPKQNYLYNLVGILMYTGIRISEAAGLTWDNIDIDNGEILIVTQYARISATSGKRIMCEPKTQSSKRTIYMTDFVKELFIKQREYCSSINVTDYVFPNKKGLPMSVRSVERAISNISGANDGRTVILPRITPHILRHTACTKMINAGIDMKTVQLIMGHSSISTTLDIYTHRNETEIKDAIKKLN